MLVVIYIEGQDYGELSLEIDAVPRAGEDVWITSYTAGLRSTLLQYTVKEVTWNVTVYDNGPNKGRQIHTRAEVMLAGPIKEESSTPASLPDDPTSHQGTGPLEGSQ